MPTFRRPEPARSLPPRFRDSPGSLVYLEPPEQQDQTICPTPPPDGPRGLCRRLRRARGHVDNILPREKVIAVGEVSGVRGFQIR